MIRENKKQKETKRHVNNPIRFVRDCLRIHEYCIDREYREAFTQWEDMHYNAYN